MTKVYSRDEERFQDDLCEVLADLDGDGYLEPGATIYEADKVEYVASKFFRGGVDDIIETIRDQAWEEAGEFAEIFAENITKEKLAELETLISNWLDANVPVNFFTVRNVKPVEVTEVMIADYRNAPASGVQAPPAPEVTDAMVDAYLRANDAYWKRTDELPAPPDKWRTGTPREATRESLRAALAAGVAVAPAPITRAEAVRMAEEVGMLGDVRLNAPSLVRFAQLVLSTYGVETGEGGKR